MARGVAIWGLVALLGAILSAILAARKNRDVSAWAAWGFLFPPVVLLFALLPRQAVRTRRRTLEEEEAAQARAEWY